MLTSSFLSTLHVSHACSANTARRWEAPMGQVQRQLSSQTARSGAGAVHFLNRSWPSMATSDISKKTKVVDSALEQFVKSMRESGITSALRMAKHAILYVQAARPRLRKTLKIAWAVLRAWEEQVPGSFRPPLPLTLLAAMTCQSRLQAARDDGRSSSSIWHVFGTLLNVGYFARLRPGELLKLKAFDIMPPTPSRWEHPLQW